MLSAAILLAVVWKVAEQRVERNSRALAIQLREDMTDEFRDEGMADLTRLVRTRAADPADRDLVLLLVDARGRVLAGNIAEWPPSVPLDSRYRQISLFRNDRAAPERMGVIGTRLDGGARLLSGYVLEDEAALFRLLGEVLTIAMLLGLLLAGIGAAITIKLVTSRIRVLEQTSSAVAAGLLSRRVPEQGTGDAFDLLGSSINNMLERIEHLVSELQVVTEGLAHDLRSPLTRLQVNLDRLSAGELDPGARAALDKAAAEAKLVLRIVATALEIARVEAGAGRERFTRIEVAPLLGDLAELYGPAFEEMGHRLEVSAEPLTLRADRALLSQSLGNLLENAIVHAVPGRVTLGAKQAGDRVLLFVADRGPGIPEHQREQAMQRFGRLDPARHGQGTGLGLSLVQAVARLHGGSFRLEDAGGGLRGVIDLPLNAGPDE
ncbi:HAMP domain-containing sensor histidine kinase [Sphingomonas astaxanthinifaciens]|uniref:histidine kinase n=1 Tax=Sphingomonas astaxanthinifaciens DSM 22298 TaxID=1123267 RepID=A0ABQ5Z8E5_9SPHN|nr:HAMP domain-containing sensor histidine kinase [Sphingomonas astaxanthinifaciens]GLR47832.1 two-component sensor histidine kinase [Sphingomonas astaxanthinifaciens DSM 22298]